MIDDLGNLFLPSSRPTCSLPQSTCLQSCLQHRSCFDGDCWASWEHWAASSLWKNISLK